ncbi:iron-sulfur cluster assembly protein [Thiohalospira halophila DSM 15071]|uniref:Iron-binding protein IscA n=1 Tax=Thiohalospira halophila DSM 15071 TaxID=1123397 RepID=A0A1I1QVC7_9GAMM|nr:iron-sulfur cluster assembly protein IscA [Thiohalospira halophila]SFD23828.1 iron-sulfur cluster assembly protein [Thiohalospira halophila DSM 15071]
MAISMTEAAADHVRRYLENRGQGEGLRVGVRTSGCSGMAYVLEFADEIEPEDQVFENHGVKVVIDPKSLVYLDGTELDYGREGLNEGFMFNNPNVSDECGCGESFNV